MKAAEVIHAWGRILKGRRPSMSLEITRECPLRCPGCYAYSDDHVGGGVNLRQVSDYKGEELITRVLALVDEHQPLHVSIVGGDPLVRYREVEVILPELMKRGVHVQLVTSAFREIPLHWAKFPTLNVTVSIDGLPAEHDVRRKPATYERILKNLAGHKKFISVHCTITSQIVRRPGYLEEFLKFWSERPEPKRVWFSLFTPQKGEIANEILSKAQRVQVTEELLELRKRYPLLDMTESTIRNFISPPHSPDRCIFAKTTKTFTADLKTQITPCQFGGTPDCSQCGCIASVGLAAVGNYKLGLGITAGHLFHASFLVGDWFERSRDKERERARLAGARGAVA